MFKLFAALSIVALGSAVAWVRTSGATIEASKSAPAGVPPKARQLGGNPSYDSPYGWPPPKSTYVFAVNRFDKGQWYGTATFFVFAIADNQAKANAAADPSTRWQVYAYPAFAGATFP